MADQAAVPATEVRRRIGLALSSGGAKGLTHIGIIQVLEENGIDVVDRQPMRIENANQQIMDVRASVQRDLPAAQIRDLPDRALGEPS